MTLQGAADRAVLGLARRGLACPEDVSNGRVGSRRGVCSSGASRVRAARGRTRVLQLGAVPAIARALEDTLDLRRRRVLTVATLVGAAGVSAATPAAGGAAKFAAAAARVM